MATRSRPWPAGTPCWADNHVPDLEVARTFYGAVLGWEIDDPDPAAGGFARARLQGRPVAGFLVAVEGAQPGWHLFFATDDIETTARRIEAHGGTCLFGPHLVPPDLGRFELARDPGGSVFGVWEGGSLTGTTVYDEPGSLVWEDLRSSTPEVAQSFYPAVFDVTMAPLPQAGLHYALFHLPQDAVRPLGGIGGLTTPDEESHWAVYFQVDDVDAALAAGQRTGGTVAAAARDTPYGRWGALVDPFGAELSVMAPSTPAPAR